MYQNDECIPVGVWLRMDLPGFPGFISFTYVDPAAGLSAKGWESEEELVLYNSGRPRHLLATVRLGEPVAQGWQILSEEEIKQLNLPETPSWLESYGPQPARGTRWGGWRQHPKLRGRFHPDYPDDIEVIVYDDDLETSTNMPERIWVRVTGMVGDIFQGVLLNQPYNLKTLNEGDEVLFSVVDGIDYPIRITEDHLRERGN